MKLHLSERQWALGSITAINVSLPYIKTSERHPFIFHIGAIGNFVTLNYTRLRRNFGPTYASGSASPSLSSTHYGRQHLCSAEGEKAVCRSWLNAHRQAAERLA